MSRGETLRGRIDREIGALDIPHFNDEDAQDDDQSRSDKIREVFLEELWPKIRSELYEPAFNELRTYVEHSVKEKGFSAVFSGRLKENESIKNTLIRCEERDKLTGVPGNPYTSLSDGFERMHDLLGLRIIPLSQEAHRGILNLMSSPGFITVASSQHISEMKHTIGEHWDKQFGSHESRNFRVNIPLELGDRPSGYLRNGSSYYKGFLFEIQVLSLADQLSGLLTHPFHYKSSFGPGNKETEQAIDVFRGICKQMSIQLDVFFTAFKNHYRRTLENNAESTADTRAEQMQGALRKEVGEKAATIISQAVDMRVRKVEMEMPESLSDSVEGRRAYWEQATGADHPLSLDNFVRNFVDELRAAQGNLLQGQQNLAKQLTDLERTALLTRLHMSDYELGKQHKEPSLSVPGTLDWFPAQQAFRHWLDDFNLLWVTAGAGCGKSVLARHLVDDILPRSNSRIVTYFFFNDGNENERNASVAIYCILHQIFLLRPELLTREISDRLQPISISRRSFRRSWDVLTKDVLSLAAAYGLEIVCVLDALDECQSNEHSDFQEVLQELDSLGACGLKLLLTGRTHCSQSPTNGKLWKFLENRPGRRSICVDADPVAQRCIDDSINLFVREVVEDLRTEWDYTQDDVSEMVSTLSLHENRTYLWVALMHTYLKGTVQIEAPALRKKSIANALKVPETVDDAYEKLLSFTRDKEKTARLLVLMVAMFRPLSLEELATLWGVESLIRDLPRTVEATDGATDEGPPFSELEMREYLLGVDDVRRLVQSLCGSFLWVSVDSKVHFIHQTAREFLLATSGKANTDNGAWKSSLQLAESHTVLCKICVSYLRSLDVPKWASYDDFLAAKPVDCAAWPLLEYSAQYWDLHYRNSDGEPALDNIPQDIRMLILGDASIFWVQAIATPGTMARAIFDNDSPLLEKLLADGADVNECVNILGLPALSLAAMSLRENILQRLLDIPGIDVNRGCHTVAGQTPLHVAVKNASKNLELLRRLLLHKGIRVNEKDTTGERPLHYAVIDYRDTRAHVQDALSWSDTNDIRANIIAGIKLLLEHPEIDINAQNVGGETSLLYAAGNGLEDVVRLLLAHPKIDVNARNDIGHSALHAAVAERREEIVRLLLSQPGINVNIQEDTQGLSPLHCTALGSDGEVQARLLLAMPEIDVNIKDKNGCTSLHNAVSLDREGIVKMLLEHPDIDINAQNDMGASVLLWAIVSKNDLGLSPMNSAGKEFAEEAQVKLLLAMPGIDANVPDDDGLSPLHAAVQREREGLVKMLVAHPGIDINVKDSNGLSAMTTAIMYGNEKILRLLLEEGKATMSSREREVLGLLAQLGDNDDRRRNIVSMARVFRERQSWWRRCTQAALNFDYASGSNMFGMGIIIGSLMGWWILKGRNGGWIKHISLLRDGLHGLIGRGM